MTDRIVNTIFVALALFGLAANAVGLIFFLVSFVKMIVQ